MKKIILGLLLAILYTTCFAQEITNTNSLIQAMYDKYNNSWYSNLTFKQKTTYYNNDTISRLETWYEAMSMPEGLIIKIGSMDSGNGFIFKNDSMYILRSNELVRKSQRFHDLLILGFSVYFDKPSVTLNKLKKSGLNTATFFIEDNYFIIGVKDNKRVWIDRKNLLFQKMESVDKNGDTHLIEFNKYKKLGEGWIAPEVVFYKNGKKQMLEEYHDIKTPETLPDNLLNVKNFGQAKW